MRSSLRFAVFTEYNIIVNKLKHNHEQEKRQNIIRSFSKGANREKTEKGSGSNVVPEELIVQQITSSPTGRLEKYERMDTREFNCLFPKSRIL